MGKAKFFTMNHFFPSFLLNGNEFEQTLGDSEGQGSLWGHRELDTNECVNNNKTSVFIAALFTAARTWKQPKCPSAEEWIEKTWCIYTVEYCLAIEGKEIMPFAETWMGLETIVQSEVNQKEKSKYCILMHICGI